MQNSAITIDFRFEMLPFFVFMELMPFKISLFIPTLVISPVHSPRYLNVLIFFLSSINDCVNETLFLLLNFSMSILTFHIEH